MDKPTFMEFAKHEKKLSTRLIETKDSKFYIEGNPYRFKLVQLLLFFMTTACALLVTYLIPSTADRAGWAVEDYLNMENSLLIIPLIYFAVVELVFIIELPQRYLFAGFKKVSENYFEDKDGIAGKGSKPFFLDVYRDTIFHQRMNFGLDYKHRRDRFIYCYNGRVFRDKHFAVYHNAWYMLWAIFPLLRIFIGGHIDSSHGIQALEYDILLSFRYTIAVSAVLAFQNLIYPVIRYVFNKFDEVDINEIYQKEEYKPRLIID
jgi:hypothetical protein